MGSSLGFAQEAAEKSEKAAGVASEMKATETTETVTEEATVETEEATVEVAAEAEGEAKDGGESVVEAVVEEVIPTTPKEAMVAVRGQSRAGMGVLAMVNEKTVVLTSLSALDGSRGVHVNTADGTPIAIGSVVGFFGVDLAFITIEGEVGDLPVYEWDHEVRLTPGDTVTLLNPRKNVDGKVGDGAPGRYALQQVQGRVFPGAPVIRGGDLVGVYSPARFLSGPVGAKGQREAVFTEGIANLPLDARWEVIDLRKMAVERESITQWTKTLNDLGAFFKVSGASGDVSSQRLLAAQKRLKDGLARASQDNEKDYERRKFVFSIRSAVGSVVSDLQEAQTGFYSYFDPEIDALIEMYRPIGAKLEALEANPRSADSYAR